ncbi:MAG: peptide chain release factor N(5)-glutamine methyltransferase [Clostridiales Family XIII bacterium]|jgi:release factor glutamine methyltransferase|nr:peptide chain release factor N(5)-glutamine methyltransferase [Clostridiales Family XIII bacterium]
MGLTVKEILNISEGILKDSGDSDYKQDAEILLCHETKYTENKLFMNWTRELEDVHTEKIFELIRRRADGTPTQYLTHEQVFMGHKFYVDEHVLIPRMDTETLVVTVTEHLKGSPAKMVLDLCTGSGVLAVCLAKAYPSLKITASDISEEALTVARKNAVSAGVDKRISFIQSDLFAAFKTGFGGKKFDLILSNPPYIKSDVLPTLQREIYEHEPMLALDGGMDGLDVYRKIIETVPAFLNKNGALFFEIGSEQASDVQALLEAADAFSEIRIIQDLSGKDRVISARLTQVYPEKKHKK